MLNNDCNECNCMNTSLLIKINYSFIQITQIPIVFFYNKIIVSIWLTSSQKAVQCEVGDFYIFLLPLEVYFDQHLELMTRTATKDFNIIVFQS